MDRCDFRPTQCQYCEEILIFKDLKVNLILFNFYFKIYDEKFSWKKYSPVVCVTEQTAQSGKMAFYSLLSLIICWLYRFVFMRMSSLNSVSYTHLPSPRDKRQSRMPSSA